MNENQKKKKKDMNEKIHMNIGVKNLNMNVKYMNEKKIYIFARN